MEEMKIDFAHLLTMAKEASVNSYSPYSNFPVGSAAYFSSGKIFKGANIENSSYGLGICAERNALATAIAAGERTKLIAIAVYSPKQKLCLPCGACLQWLSEIRSVHNHNEDITVILEGDNGVKTFKLSELLPHSFKID